MEFNCCYAVDCFYIGTNLGSCNNTTSYIIWKVLYISKNDTNKNNLLQWLMNPNDFWLWLPDAQILVSQVDAELYQQPNIYKSALRAISPLMLRELESNHITKYNLKEAGNIVYMYVLKEGDCFSHKHVVSIMNTNEQNHRKLNSNGQ